MSLRRRPSGLVVLGYKGYLGEDGIRRLLRRGLTEPPHACPVPRPFVFTGQPH